MCLLDVRRSGLIDINNTGKSLTVTQPHYLAAAEWCVCLCGGGGGGVTQSDPRGALFFLGGKIAQ